MEINDSAHIWMKRNNIDKKIIEYLLSLLRHNKNLNSITYTIQHLINDLEAGVIQRGHGIGYKKIEDLFTKLQADGFALDYKLTKDCRMRKKWFGIF